MALTPAQGRTLLGWMLVALGMLAFSPMSAWVFASGTTDTHRLMLTGQWQTQVTMILAGGLGFGAIVTRVAAWRFLRDAARRDPLLPVMLLLATASIAWSILPDVTLRRSLALILLTLCALGIASCLDFTRALRAFMAGYTTLAFVTLVTWMVYPQAVLQDFEGEHLLHGFMGHKNDFGRGIAQGLVLAGGVFMLAQRFPLGPLLAACLCGFALFGSFSKSGMLGSVAALSSGLAGALLLRRRGTVRPGATHIATAPVLGLPVAPMLWLTVLIGPAIIGLLLVISPTYFDPTMTGRTLVWEEAMDAVGGPKLLGHGLGAFWIARYGSSAPQADVDWIPLHGHNAWVDMSLDLGWIGLLVCVGWFAHLCTTVVRRVIRPEAQVLDSVLIPLLVLHLAISVTGTAFFHHLTIAWFVLLTLACCARATWTRDAVA